MDLPPPPPPLHGVPDDLLVRRLEQELRDRGYVYGPDPFIQRLCLLFGRLIFTVYMAKRVEPAPACGLPNREVEFARWTMYSLLRLCSPFARERPHTIAQFLDELIGEVSIIAPCRERLLLHLAPLVRQFRRVVSAPTRFPC